jgi:hypothetical protein
MSGRPDSKRSKSKQRKRPRIKRDAKRLLVLVCTHSKDSVEAHAEAQAAVELRGSVIAVAAAPRCLTPMLLQTPTLS